MMSIFFLKSAMLSEDAEIGSSEHQTPLLLNLHYVNEHFCSDFTGCEQNF